MRTRNQNSSSLSGGPLCHPLIQRSLRMSATMDVFVLGEAAGSPYEFIEPKWPIASRVIPTGVATFGDFDRSPWASSILDGEAEFAAIVAGSDRELLRQ